MDKVKIMKRFLIKLLILFSIVFLFDACSDPVFFIIHEETPALKPLINGSPTNFVIFGDAMYVASGKKIFIYRKNTNKWVEWTKLGDYVGCLAATQNSLYAFYLVNNNGRIRQFDNTGNGVDLSLTNVQSIYALDDDLFVGVRVTNGNDFTYSILHTKESIIDFKSVFEGSSKKNSDDPTVYDYTLNGAAYDNNNYYLCTYSSIFYVNKTNVDSDFVSIPNSDSDKKFIGFTGIINLNANYVAAITNSGDLFQIEDANIEKKASFDKRNSTGALALWYKDKSDAEPSLLLVGRKEYYYSSTTTAYSNGYLEIALNPSGGIQTNAVFTEPGKNKLSSIDNNDRYVSSIGKKPVNHMIQTPAVIDEKMTLFASTQQNGVWSYRIRQGVMQWNAEQ